MQPPNHQTYVILKKHQKKKGLKRWFKTKWLQLLFQTLKISTSLDSQFLRHFRVIKRSKITFLTTGNHIEQIKIRLYPWEEVFFTVSGAPCPLNEGEESLLTLRELPSNSC